MPLLEMSPNMQGMESPGRKRTRDEFEDQDVLVKSNVNGTISHTNSGKNTFHPRSIHPLLTGV
jgi:hypothetical protein